MLENKEGCCHTKDNSKLIKYTSWKPKYDLKTGLKIVYDMFFSTIFFLLGQLTKKLLWIVLS